MVARVGKRGGRHGEDIPLQTLSMVLTWLPSSIWWMEKSISGRGFFCCMARIALSTWALRGSWEPGRPAPSASMVGGEARTGKAMRGEARRGVRGRERVREGKSAKSCLSSQVWRLWAARKVQQKDTPQVEKGRENACYQQAVARALEGVTRGVGGEDGELVEVGLRTGTGALEDGETDSQTDKQTVRQAGKSQPDGGTAERVEPRQRVQGTFACPPLLLTAPQA